MTNAPHLPFSHQNPESLPSYLTYAWYYEYFAYLHTYLP